MNKKRNVDSGRKSARPDYIQKTISQKSSGKRSGKVFFPKTLIGYTHATDMFNLLKAQTRCNKIPAQLPEGVKTANKTGELDNVENDAGIIYDSKNDVVIVFMSQNLSSADSAQNTIATLSRTIYDYYN